MHQVTCVGGAGGRGVRESRTLQGACLPCLWHAMTTTDCCQQNPMDSSNCGATRHCARLRPPVGLPLHCRVEAFCASGLAVTSNIPCNGAPLPSRLRVPCCNAVHARPPRKRGWQGAAAEKRASSLFPARPPIPAKRGCAGLTAVETGQVTKSDITWHPR